jgi:hypothetical protein
VREQRDRGHPDLAFLAVDARDLEALVRRAALVESDSCGPLLQRHWLGVEGARLVPARELLDRHLTGLGERDLEDLLGGLVEEDEPAAVVDDHRRRREVRGELASEDQDEVLLARLVLLHWPSVRPCGRGYTVRPAGA